MSSVKKSPNTLVKESSVLIDGKEFKVVSHFEGTETASKLIYDMAVSMVLNDPKLPMGSNGESR